ncbi:tRNA (guanosine(46)-N7)-methyltransferase TrmB [Candidatus Saccharibacteria bacterium]|nr:tRNA (guanosine(46)-N7)-methyltransferase TrmB [Candidatus Saccharibacteria bacterium]
MSQLLNLEEYIISRKRKKYKFAKFANANNCFEYDSWIAGAQQGELPSQIDILEVGAGTGLFSVELAQRKPDKVVVALDVKADRLQKGAYLALEKGLTNIYFIRARADQLSELFSSQLIKKIWLTFPDPYPKRRNRGRRLTHLSFIEIYKNILDKNGSVYLKHDNLEFFQWSLEQFVKSSWRIDKLSFDLHQSSQSDDYKILTTYEERWLSEDRKTKFAKADII